MAQYLIIDLYISADEYLRHYKGQVTQVVCEARDGRRVRFPSSILQRFVTRSGIHGSFRIDFDHGNKLVAVERIV